MRRPALAPLAGARPPRAGARPASRGSGSRRRASPAAAGRVAAASRLRSSTAASESKPRSLKAFSGSTVVGGGVAEDRGDLGLGPAPGRAPRAPPRGRRRARASEPAGLARRARGRGRGRAGAAAGSPPAARARRATGSRRTGASRASVERAGGVEEREALLGGERARRPARPIRAQVGLAQAGGHARCASPRGPRRSRSPGRPSAPAPCGERVEEGVGGGVVALAGAAEQCRRSRRRGRSAESSRLRGQLVQVPGGIGLGGEDPLEALGVERVEQAVVEDAGGVDHRAQGMLSGIAASSASAGRDRRRRRRRSSPRRPAPASSARSSAAPSASAPRRLTKSRWRAPWCSTRWRAKRAPRPPVAAGDQDGALGVEGRGPRRRPAGRPRRAAAPGPPSRRASCGSRRRRERGRAGPRRCLAPSLSIRAKRPGCSEPAERSRPQRGCRDQVGGLPLRGGHRVLGEEDQARLE